MWVEIAVRRGVSKRFGRAPYDQRSQTMSPFSQHDWRRHHVVGRAASGANQDELEILGERSGISHRR
jgi:hypothetical protein